MLDARRRQYLEAMGIDLWVRRAPASAELASESAETPKRLPEFKPVSEPPVTATAAPRVPEPQLSPSRAEPQSERLERPERAAAAPVVAAEPTTASPSAPLEWPELERAIAGCSRCPEPVANRTRTVFGAGDRTADWMVIGDAPGEEEDVRGEPFVGRSGQLLTAMLKACGFAREQVFITNTLKCRLPDDREPRLEEQAACFPFLQRQIELVAPRGILAMGRIAAQRLLETDASIGDLRGHVHRLPGSDIPVVVTYHPAYLLRSPEKKAGVWDDLKLALRRFSPGE